MKNTNAMGSEVVKGFKCKPQVLDENKPIMFTAIHLFLCEGERCKSKKSAGLADRLRSLTKELGFDRGEDRIKITRTHCNGACRFGQFAYTYKNVGAKCYSEHNAFTAWKKVNEWTNAQWQDLFISLVKNQSASSIISFKVEQQLFPS